jgi:glutaredoxin-related protein
VLFIGCDINQIFYHGGSDTSSNMRLSLPDRALRREIGQRSTYSSFAGIYGDSEFVDGLDIVNELGGHTGCVNALR